VENQQDPAPFTDRCKMLGLKALTFVPGIPFPLPIP
jgi:hypothetical protein